MATDSSVVPLRQKMITEDPVFHQKDFMLVLERNLPQLKDTAIQQTITMFTAKRYEGDFYGLCLEMGIGHDLVYLTMRLNNLRSLDDYDGNTTQIATVDEKTLQTIVDLHSQIQTMF